MAWYNVGYVDIQVINYNELKQDMLLNRSIFVATYSYILVRTSNSSSQTMSTRKFYWLSYGISVSVLPID